MTTRRLWILDQPQRARVLCLLGTLFVSEMINFINTCLTLVDNLLFSENNVKFDNASKSRACRKSKS